MVDRRLVTVLAEVLLAGFVAGVTIFLADLLPARGWPEVFYPSAPVLTAVIACAVVLMPARRRFAVVALLAATVLFGLFPATGVALAVIAHAAGARGRRWPLFGLAALLPAAVVRGTGGARGGHRRRRDRGRHRRSGQGPARGSGQGSCSRTPIRRNSSRPCGPRPRRRNPSPLPLAFARLLC